MAFLDRFRPKGPTERAPERVLTVFDMFERPQVTFETGDAQKVASVMLVLKPLPANSPFKSLSEMMKDYPGWKENSNRDAQEYSMVLRGDNAQRFVDGYRQHHEELRKQKPGRDV